METMGAEIKIDLDALQKAFERIEQLNTLIMRSFEKSQRGFKHTTGQIGELNAALKNSSDQASLLNANLSSINTSLSLMASNLESVSNKINGAFAGVNKSADAAKASMDRMAAKPFSVKMEVVNIDESVRDVTKKVKQMQDMVAKASKEVDNELYAVGQKRKIGTTTLVPQSVVSTPTTQFANIFRPAIVWAEALRKELKRVNETAEQHAPLYAMQETIATLADSFQLLASETEAVDFENFGIKGGNVFEYLRKQFKGFTGDFSDLVKKTPAELSKVFSFTEGVTGDLFQSMAGKGGMGPASALNRMVEGLFNASNMAQFQKASAELDAYVNKYSRLKAVFGERIDTVRSIAQIKLFATTVGDFNNISDQALIRIGTLAEEFNRLSASRKDTSSVATAMRNEFKSFISVLQDAYVGVSQFANQLSVADEGILQSTSKWSSRQKEMNMLADTFGDVGVGERGGVSTQVNSMASALESMITNAKRAKAQIGATQAQMVDFGSASENIYIDLRKLMTEYTQTVEKLGVVTETSFGIMMEKSAATRDFAKLSPFATGSRPLAGMEEFIVGFGEKGVGVISKELETISQTGQKSVNSLLGPLMKYQKFLTPVMEKLEVSIRNTAVQMSNAGKAGADIDKAIEPANQLVVTYKEVTEAIESVIKEFQALAAGGPQSLKQQGEMALRVSDSLDVLYNGLKEIDSAWQMLGKGPRGTFPVAELTKSKILEIADAYSLWEAEDMQMRNHLQSTGEISVENLQKITTKIINLSNQIQRGEKTEIKIGADERELALNDKILKTRQRIVELRTKSEMKQPGTTVPVYSEEVVKAMEKEIKSQLESLKHLEGMQGTLKPITIPVKVGDVQTIRTELEYVQDKVATTFRGYAGIPKEVIASYEQLRRSLGGDIFGTEGGLEKRVNHVKALLSKLVLGMPKNILEDFLSTGRMPLEYAEEFLSLMKQIQREGAAGAQFKPITDLQSALSRFKPDEVFGKLSFAKRFGADEATVQSIQEEADQFVRLQREAREASEQKKGLGRTQGDLGYLTEVATKYFEKETTAFRSLGSAAKSVQRDIASSVKGQARLFKSSLGEKPGASIISMVGPGLENQFAFTEEVQSNLFRFYENVNATTSKLKEVTERNIGHWSLSLSGGMRNVNATVKENAWRIGSGLNDLKGSMKGAIEFPWGKILSPSMATEMKTNAITVVGSLDRVASSFYKFGKTGYSQKIGGDVSSLQKNMGFLLKIWDDLNAQMAAGKTGPEHVPAMNRIWSMIQQLNQAIALIEAPYKAIEEVQRKAEGKLSKSQLGKVFSSQVSAVEKRGASSIKAIQAPLAEIYANTLRNIFDAEPTDALSSWQALVNEWSTTAPQAFRKALGKLKGEGYVVKDFMSAIFGGLKATEVPLDEMLKGSNIGKEVLKTIGFQTARQQQYQAGIKEVMTKFAGVPISEGLGDAFKFVGSDKGIIHEFSSSILKETEKGYGAVDHTTNTFVKNFQSRMAKQIKGLYVGKDLRRILGDVFDPGDVTNLQAYSGSLSSIVKTVTTQLGLLRAGRLKEGMKIDLDISGGARAELEKTGASFGEFEVFVEDLQSKASQSIQKYIESQDIWTKETTEDFITLLNYWRNLGEAVSSVSDLSRLTKGNIVGVEFTKQFAQGSFKDRGKALGSEVVAGYIGALNAQASVSSVRQSLGATIQQFPQMIFEIMKTSGVDDIAALPSAKLRQALEDLGFEMYGGVGKLAHNIESITGKKLDVNWFTGFRQAKEDFISGSEKTKTAIANLLEILNKPSSFKMGDMKQFLDSTKSSLQAAGVSSGAFSTRIFSDFTRLGRLSSDELGKVQTNVNGLTGALKRSAQIMQTEPISRNLLRAFRMEDLDASIREPLERAFQGLPMGLRMTVDQMKTVDNELMETTYSIARKMESFIAKPATFKYKLDVSDEVEHLSSIQERLRTAFETVQNVGEKFGKGNIPTALRYLIEALEQLSVQTNSTMTNLSRFPQVLKATGDTASQLQKEIFKTSLAGFDIDPTKVKQFGDQFHSLLVQSLKGPTSQDIAPFWSKLMNPDVAGSFFTKTNVGVMNTWIEKMKGSITPDRIGTIFEKFGGEPRIFKKFFDKQSPQMQYFISKLFDEAGMLTEEGIRSWLERWDKAFIGKMPEEEKKNLVNFMQGMVGTLKEFESTGKVEVKPKGDRSIIDWAKSLGLAGESLRQLQVLTKDFDLSFFDTWGKQFAKPFTTFDRDVGKTKKNLAGLLYMMGGALERFSASVTLVGEAFKSLDSTGVGPNRMKDLVKGLVNALKQVNVLFKESSGAPAGWSDSVVTSLDKVFRVGKGMTEFSQGIQSLTRMPETLAELEPKMHSVSAAVQAASEKLVSSFGKIGKTMRAGNVTQFDVSMFSKFVQGIRGVSEVFPTLMHLSEYLSNLKDPKITSSFKQIADHVQLLFEAFNKPLRGSPIDEGQIENFEGLGRVVNAIATPLLRIQGLDFTGTVSKLNENSAGLEAAIQKLFTSMSNITITTEAQTTINSFHTFMDAVGKVDLGQPLEKITKTVQTAGKAFKTAVTATMNEVEQTLEKETGEVGQSAFASEEFMADMKGQMGLIPANMSELAGQAVVSGKADKQMMAFSDAVKQMMAVIVEGQSEFGRFGETLTKVAADMPASAFGALSGVVEQLNLQGNLTPQIINKISNEVTNLVSRAAGLDPAFEAAAQEINEMKPQRVEELAIMLDKASQAANSFERSRGLLALNKRMIEARQSANQVNLEVEQLLAGLQGVDLRSALSTGASRREWYSYVSDLRVSLEKAMAPLRAHTAFPEVNAELQKMTSNVVQLEKVGKGVLTFWDRFSGVIRNARDSFANLLAYQTRWYLSQQIFWSAFGQLDQIVMNFGEFDKQIRRVLRTLRDSQNAILGVDNATRIAAESGAKWAQVTSKAMMGMFESSVRTSIQSSMKDLGASVTESAEVLYQLGSAGLTATESFAAFRPVLGMVIGTEVEARETTKMVAGVYHVFADSFGDAKNEAEKFTQIVDVLTVAYRDHQIEMEEVISGLSYVVAGAKLSNLSFQETVAALAVLNDNLLRGSKAGRGLNRVLTESATKTYEFRRLLTNFPQLIPLSDESMRAGLVNTVNSIIGSLDELVAKGKDVRPFDYLIKVGEVIGPQLQKVGVTTEQVSDIFETMGMVGARAFAVLIMNAKDYDIALAQMQLTSYKAGQDITDIMTGSFERAIHRLEGFGRAALSQVFGFARGIIQFMANAAGGIQDLFGRMSESVGKFIGIDIFGSYTDSTKIVAMLGTLLTINLVLTKIRGKGIPFFPEIDKINSGLFTMGSRFELLKTEIGKLNTIAASGIKTPFMMASGYKEVISQLETIPGISSKLLQGTALRQAKGSMLGLIQGVSKYDITDLDGFRLALGKFGEIRGIGPEATESINKFFNVWHGTVKDPQTVKNAIDGLVSAFKSLGLTLTPDMVRALSTQPVFASGLAKGAKELESSYSMLGAVGQALKEQFGAPFQAAGNAIKSIGLGLFDAVKYVVGFRGSVSIATADATRGFQNVYKAVTLLSIGVKSIGKFGIQMVALYAFSAVISKVFETFDRLLRGPEQLADDVGKAIADLETASSKYLSGIPSLAKYAESTTSTFRELDGYMSKFSDGTVDANKNFDDMSASVTRMTVLMSGEASKTFKDAFDQKNVEGMQKAFNEMLKTVPDIQSNILKIMVGDLERYAIAFQRAKKEFDEAWKGAEPPGDLRKFWNDFVDGMVYGFTKLGNLIVAIPNGIYDIYRKLQIFRETGDWVPDVSKYEKEMAEFESKRTGTPLPVKYQADMANLKIAQQAAQATLRASEAFALNMARVINVAGLMDTKFGGTTQSFDELRNKFHEFTLSGEKDLKKIDDAISPIADNFVKALTKEVPGAYKLIGPFQDMIGSIGDMVAKGLIQPATLENNLLSMFPDVGKKEAGLIVKVLMGKEGSIRTKLATVTMLFSESLADWGKQADSMGKRFGFRETIFSLQELIKLIERSTEETNAFLELFGAAETQRIKDFSNSFNKMKTGRSEIFSNLNLTTILPEKLAIKDADHLLDNILPSSTALGKFQHGLINAVEPLRGAVTKALTTDESGDYFSRWTEQFTTIVGEWKDFEHGITSATSQGFGFTVFKDEINAAFKSFDAINQKQNEWRQNVSNALDTFVMKMGQAGTILQATGDLAQLEHSQMSKLGKFSAEILKGFEDANKASESEEGVSGEQRKKLADNLKTISDKVKEQANSWKDIGGQVEASITRVGELATSLGKVYEIINGIRQTAADINYNFGLKAQEALKSVAEGFSKEMSWGEMLNLDKLISQVERAANLFNQAQFGFTQGKLKPEEMAESANKYMSQIQASMTESYDNMWNVLKDAISSKFGLLSKQIESRVNIYFDILERDRKFAGDVLQKRIDKAMSESTRKSALFEDPGIARMFQDLAATHPETALSVVQQQLQKYTDILSAGGKTDVKLTASQEKEFSQLRDAEEELRHAVDERKIAEDRQKQEMKAEASRLEFGWIGQIFQDAMRQVFAGADINEALSGIMNSDMIPEEYKGKVQTAVSNYVMMAKIYKDANKKVEETLGDIKGILEAQLKEAQNTTSSLASLYQNAGVANIILTGTLANIQRWTAEGNTAAAQEAFKNFGSAWDKLSSTLTEIRKSPTTEAEKNNAMAEAFKDFTLSFGRTPEELKKVVEAAKGPESPYRTGEQITGSVQKAFEETASGLTKAFGSEFYTNIDNTKKGFGELAVVLNQYKDQLVTSVTGTPSHVQPTTPNITPVSPEGKSLFGFKSDFKKIEVKDIVDGDTLSIIENGIPVKVRIFGLDAPESGQPGYTEAKKFLEDWIAKEGALYLQTVQGKDSYGRKVGRLVGGTTGEEFGLESIREGFSMPFERYLQQNQDLLSLYKAALDQAKSNQSGVWGLPPDQLKILTDYREKREEGHVKEGDWVGNWNELFKNLPATIGADVAGAIVGIDTSAASEAFKAKVQELGTTMEKGLGEIQKAPLDDVSRSIEVTKTNIESFNRLSESFGTTLVTLKNGMELFADISTLPDKEKIEEPLNNIKTYAEGFSTTLVTLKNGLELFADTSTLSLKNGITTAAVDETKANVESLNKTLSDGSISMQAVESSLVGAFNSIASAIASAASAITSAASAASSSSEGYRWGGLIKRQTGGLLPGYGGGDKIPLLAEGGEFMIAKERVKQYGVDFVDAINEGKLNLDNIAKSQTVSIQSSATKSRKNIVPGEGSLKHFKIEIGDTEFRGMATDSMLNQLEQGLSRKRLVRRRS